MIEQTKRQKPKLELDERPEFSIKGAGQIDLKADYMKDRFGENKMGKRECVEGGRLSLTQKSIKAALSFYLSCLISQSALGHYTFPIQPAYASE